MSGINDMIKKGNEYYLERADREIEYHGKSDFNIKITENGVKLNDTEISISTEDEEIQSKSAEQIYKICFSHPSVNGVFWWNLDDDGILATQERKEAAGENLPFGGLCRKGKEKAVYHTLDKLINHEWHTEGVSTASGELSFRGFYKIYEITVNKDGITRTYDVDFSKKNARSAELTW